MKTYVGIALAAALLLSGVSAASAAGMSNSASMPKASDTLTLSATQRKTAWNDISKNATKHSAPSGFTASVGAKVPATLSTLPIPSKAASDLPALRPYHFAMLQKKILIVNPSDQKVVDVITQ